MATAIQNRRAGKNFTPGGTWGIKVDPDPPMGTAYGFSFTDLIPFDNCPEEIRLAKPIDVTTISNPAMWTPLLVYGVPTVMQTTIEILYDKMSPYYQRLTIPEASDRMMEVQENLMKLARPHPVRQGGRLIQVNPPVVVMWGTRWFKGMLRNVEFREAMFDKETGRATRVWASLDMLIVAASRLLPERSVRGDSLIDDVSSTGGAPPGKPVATGQGGLARTQDIISRTTKYSGGERTIMDTPTRGR